MQDDDDDDDAVAARVEKRKDPHDCSPPDLCLGLLFPVSSDHLGAKDTKYSSLDQSILNFRFKETGGV